MSAKNLLQIFQDSVTRKRSAPCFIFKANKEWQTISWDEVYQKVVDLAGGLKKLGIKKGDRISIFSRSCYEWTVADLAILSCGAISVPIYESSLPDQAAYILNNADVKIVFVEDAPQLKKIQEVRAQLTSLQQMIVFDLSSKKLKEDGIYTLDEVILLGFGNGQSLFTQMCREIDRDTEATYVYTSGTTGPPKGAILTHGNILAELEALTQVLEFKEHYKSFLFLPLAHILARLVQFAQIQCGFIQSYAESIDKLLDNLIEVQPHIMASVPRIFEKVHTRVMQGVEAGSDFKKRIFYWALNIGEIRSRYLMEGKGIPLLIKIQWSVAYKLVFSKLHEKLGGHIQYFISGGAPLSKEIGDFFHAAGFLILEGYGLTETTAAITCNSKQHLKMGTVGRAVSGVEIKIANDGEILVKGALVFKGYYKRPEDTKNALDDKGWFHTGDIGIFDSEGFLKITDRKKDIIVTAAGKNIAPQNIENIIKTDPFISQVMIHGDKRKFLSALITLNQEEVVNYAKDQKINFQNYDDLIKNNTIYNFIKERIEEKNKHLAKYETVKKFAILPQDFSIETGELTPTMKVKRKFTSDKYKDILDGFYKE